VITLLVPVFEEKNNISNFVNKTCEILKDIDFKILFVDDNSKDGSINELENICKNFSYVNYIIRKAPNRDLTESLKLGILNIDSNLICVTDCDLQHDLKKIPKMISKVLKDNYDLVIGSRFLNNNKKIGLSFRRKLSSKIGIYLSKFVGIKNLSDPLSGFFVVKTNIIKNLIGEIDSKGFKLLLSLLFVSGDKIKICEIDTDFFFRKEDKSKLDFKIKIIFLKQLMKIFIKKIKKKW